MKTILDYITEELQKSHFQKGYFADGVRYILRLAETSWLPALKYSAEEIAAFHGDAEDVIAWAAHGTVPTPEGEGVFEFGVKYGAEKIPEILGYEVLYVVEGVSGTDLEGMTFAVCTSKESADAALKASFDGEDVKITPILADSVIIDGKIVRTKSPAV